MGIGILQKRIYSDEKEVPKTRADCADVAGGAGEAGGWNIILAGRTAVWAISPPPPLRPCVPLPLCLRLRSGDTREKMWIIL